MKINITDANGQVIEIEVTDEVGAFYLASYEDEKSNDRAETRRHNQLSQFVYEDARYFDSGINIGRSVAEADAVNRVMDKLSERQRYLLNKVYGEGWRYTEIAAQEGKDESTIRKASDKAKQKFLEHYQK